MGKGMMETLLDQDNDTLADWWCILNKWEWPKGLPGEESPAEFSTSAAVSRRSRAMNHIEYVVGMDALLDRWRLMLRQDHRYGRALYMMSIAKGGER